MRGTIPTKDFVRAWRKARLAEGADPTLAFVRVVVKYLPRKWRDGQPVTLQFQGANRTVPPKPLPKAQTLEHKPIGWARLREGRSRYLQGYCFHDAMKQALAFVGDAPFVHAVVCKVRDGFLVEIGPAKDEV